MVDIPGDSTTTRSITVGGTASDTLEVVGDHDWFRIQLTAGQSISVFLDGLTLEDSYLRIYDSNGQLLFENDDINPGVIRDSELAFTADYTGTYYIDVGAWEDDYAGTYQLSVNTYTPPPVATVQQQANQLTHGYWDGDYHHFNVAPGGTITVNITALTTAGQQLATAALAAWSDIIGVTFQQVTTGGQIVFDDDEEGAHAESQWGANHIISTSHVNVSTEWLANYGTALNGYSFQTYIHEIGHALGLGHAGNYNGDARFPFDASFLNDGWPVSVMSYFSQTDSSYYTDLGFDENFIVTPMMADIYAMSLLYGLSTTTRAGNTTYGSASDWHANMGALCIFDSGGIDTIDCSGLGGSHRIDLNPGSFSNIMGEVGNVSIALGVVIENATGSSGNDTLIGNDVANDLRGGGGNDTLLGGAGDDWLAPGVGNNNLDGGSGTDTVDYVLDTIASVSVNLALGTAASGPGTDTLTSIENVRGTHENDTITGSNVANVLQGNFGSDTINGGDGDDTLIGDHDGTPAIAFNDILNGGAGADSLTGNLGADRLTGGSGNDRFIDTAAGLNGDTITDFATGDKIVITNASLAGFSFSLSGSTLTYTGGSLTLTGFSGQLQASAAAGGGVQLTVVGATSDVRNDFNGDGRSDILWRHQGGTISDWLGTASGGFTPNDANAAASVPTAWKIAGTGDFNGDGRDDILWRHDNGQLSNWLGTANGGFAPNDANAASTVPTEWRVAGTGDFNGDGRDDILWRHDNGQLSNWLGTASGGFTVNDANAASTVPTDWHVVGTGDFNGDGKDDLLWRSDTGQLSNWLGNASGGFTPNDANAFTGAPTSWHVAGIGDFNGDNRDDILWRSDAGQLSNWLATVQGGFTANDANAMTQVGIDWFVTATGDYNGDGRDDILWRSNSGQLSNWLGTANGGFTPNDANAMTSVPTQWQVESPDIFWV